MKAIRVESFGGPEVLRLGEVPDPQAGPGQLLVRVEAAGVNFIDVYHRTGLYPNPLPLVPGQEGAGVVEAVGPGVEGFREGDRVAWASSLGSYAERALVPASVAVRLPAAVDAKTAAAVLLQGMTAHYLCTSTYPLKAGDTCLVHAAAGGVGLIACQWAKHLGATVIGTVGSDAKVELARARGCDHVIVSTREDIVVRVKEITRGAGVPVVYDSVGKDTWDASLNCLAPLGMMVTYGNSSGPVPPFSPLVLSTKGSLFLTRPTLMAYTASRDDLLQSANELFEVVRAGAVKIEVGQVYPLDAAADAHRALESRRTTGSTLLLP
jgi:NADPH2:quinone reductase